ncbi:ParD-like family protein [Microbacterium sediminicola]|uniref:ParD-like family protein n=1 Tax=Microbacterium sediminicola TaxID=415210 RepID=A0ABN2IJE9_9MICO
MAGTMPTRVDGELFEAARAAGATASRSAAQQLAHWARLGRELEASPTASLVDIRRVLEGRGSYDDLGEHEQAVVRNTWDEEIQKRRAALNLARRFQEQGRTWSEVDDDGQVVTRGENTH